MKGDMGNVRFLAVLLGSLAEMERLVSRPGYLKPDRRLSTRVRHSDRREGLQSVDSGRPNG